MSKFNISLLRAAEGTGPVKPGNLIIQGAKSCGVDRKIRPAADYPHALKCLAVSPSAFFIVIKED